MGWTGTWMDCCPKGKNRIEAAIQQEGYSYKDGDRSSEVLDSALVGSTVYLAVHHEDKSKGIDLVYGVVILTRYEDHEFMTKPISEDSGPFSYDCPKRILKLLSPTDNENALQWRSLCEKRRKEKSQRWPCRDRDWLPDPAPVREKEGYRAGSVQARKPEGVR